MTTPVLNNPESERRRSPRYELAGATIVVRGHELPVQDISVLGLRTQGRKADVKAGAVIAVELRLQRPAPGAPPRRFPLIATVIAHSERGLVLRWLQPSAGWTRAFAGHLAKAARVDGT